MAQTALPQTQAATLKLVSPLAGQTFLPVTIVGVLFAIASTHWILIPAFWILWAAWMLLPTEEGPPVIALAFTNQWVQVFCGLFYFPIFGRTSQFPVADHMPMVMLGAGVLLFLLMGLVFGLWWGRPHHSLAHTRPANFFDVSTLFFLYIAFATAGSLIQQFAVTMPGVMQALVAISYFRLAFLFLLIRRYMAPTPRWNVILPLLAAEIAIGFTGYFANFREALAVLILAFLERFDRRKREHWWGLALMVSVGVFLGLVWTSVKPQFRRDLDQEAVTSTRLDRVARIFELSGNLFDGSGNVMTTLDKLVNRQWPLYYPSRAVQRVPDAEAHTGGAFLQSAFLHILQPRMFFPDKAPLMEDSAKVRKYSGVWVAGSERNTSIAFGYAAESYVDFGFPLMFVPAFGYGLAMALMFRWTMKILIHRDLAIAVSTVVFWLGLYLFERSWDRIIGITMTQWLVMVAVGWGLEAMAGKR